MLDAGHPVYLLDYGDVSYADRDAGIERWVDDIIPPTVDRVAVDAGGGPVHLVGWAHLADFLAAPTGAGAVPVPSP